MPIAPQGQWAFLRLYKGENMITIHNFNEAHQLHQTGLIPYRLLQDQAQVMLSLTTYLSMANAFEITDDNILWLMKQPDSNNDYSLLFGGHFYICECEEDLKLVVGCDFEWAESNGGWPNVTDLPMSWDNCSYLQEATGDPQWVTFLMCWNNAGGSVYYVPKHLWELAKVGEHIALTELASK